MKLRRALRSTPGHVVLIALAVLQLFPIFLVFINSFKTSFQVAENPLALPHQLDLSNFTTAWDYGHFGTGFVNSLLLVATTIVVVLVCASLAGYVLAGKKIRGVAACNNVFPCGCYYPNMAIPVSPVFRVLEVAPAEQSCRGRLYRRGY